MWTVVTTFASTLAVVFSCVCVCVSTLLWLRCGGLGLVWYSMGRSGPNLLMTTKPTAMFRVCCVQTAAATQTGSAA